MKLAHRRGERAFAFALSALFALLAIVPVALPSFSGSARLDPLAAYRGAEFSPNELMVRLQPGITLASTGEGLYSSSAALTSALHDAGFVSASEALPGLYKLTARGPIDVLGVAAEIGQVAGVGYAVPNGVVRIMRTPNDEQYNNGQQWGVSQIKSEQAWDVTTGSENIVIAILDSGTATDHPDLAEKIVRGYDFYQNDNDPYDDNGHGTLTAGIAAASSNNGTGVVGISWGARIMPVKALGGPRGTGSDEGIARGIRWAVDNGARIINASLGGSIDTPVMRDAVRYAADRNVLVVAASGNTPDGQPHYPAAYDSVLAVGATGRNDTFTGFSSWGPYVDVTAPGVGILSTGWDNGTLSYEYFNGTSASCPFVAGVAALVWSVNPNLTAEQVKWIIEDSSDDFGPPGFDENYGKGRVNADRAVRMAQQGPPAARTPTPVSRPTNTPGAATPTAPPAQGPSLQVDTRQVVPGSLIAIVGAGFGPSENIDLQLTLPDNSSRGLGSAQTNSQGGFRAEAALPLGISTGEVTLTAIGQRSTLRASVRLTVTQGQAGVGQSVVKGVVRGTNLMGVAVVLKPSLGVSGGDLTAQIDAGGNYRFEKLASGFYSLVVTVSGSLSAGPFSVQVDGSAADVKTLDIIIAGSRPPAFDRVPPVANTPDLAFFNEVGHTVRGPFLKFWRENGGLAVFGYPLTEEFTEVSPTDGKSYKVQYFERNRFEYHPEFAGTRNEVLMGLLGVEMTRGRTFPKSAPFDNIPTHVYFRETGHSLGGPFLKYWRERGGLPIFGYPISEELVERNPVDGKEYTVQYFERNRFEYHPEFKSTTNEVLLGLLGVEIVKRNGWMAP